MSVQLDVTGRRRSPAATPGFLCGRVPPTKVVSTRPGPPRPEEIIRVMRQAGTDRHGLSRIRALIAVLWRAGLRISEALALTETDVDTRHGALLVHHGKGDKRREAGMTNGALSTSTHGLGTASTCRPDRCSA